MASSDNTGEFQSYQPVVGRIKSKRWVQASAPSYDGGDWDDGYGYSDEEVPEMPEMPELPDEYAANVPQEKLHLGTSHQTETELHKTPSASEQFVEEGVTKYALHDGSVEKESPAIGTDATDDDDVSRGDEVEVVSETAAQVEQESDSRHHEAVQETQTPAVPESDDQQDVASRTSSERKIPPVLMVGPATPPATSGKEESAFASDSTSARNQGVTENNEENTTAGANAPAYADDAYDSNKNLHIDPVGDGVVESAQVSPGDYPTDIYGYYADDGSKNGSDADLGERADDSLMEVPPPESSGSSSVPDSGHADAAAQVLETSGPAPGVAPSGELQAESESAKDKDGSAERDVDPAVLAAAVPAPTGNDILLTSGDQHEQRREARDQLRDEPSHSQDDLQRTPVLGSGGLSSGGTVPMRRMSSSGHHALYPTDSVHSYGGEDETDSTASLSTGRRSLDSSADQRSMRTSMDVPSHMRSKQGSLRQPLHEYDEDNLPPDVDDHEVYSPPAAASPSVSGGRWKPLATELPPASTGGAGEGDSPADSPTTNQSKLEREIMGTFRPPAGGAAAAGVAAGSAVGAGAAVAARHHAKQPSIEVDEYSEPDPEIAALYQNTSSFLSRPLSGYDYENMAPIEPLATNRSGQSAVSSERAFASETERGSDPAAHSPAVGGDAGSGGAAADSSSSSSSSSSSPSPSQSPDPNQSLEAVSGAQVGTESARAEDDDNDASAVPRHRQTDLDEEQQAAPMPRRKSSLDQFDDFDSDFTRERAGSALSADSDGSANAAGVTSAGVAAGAAVAAGTAGAIAASSSRDSDGTTPTPVRKDSVDTTGEPLNRVQTSSSTTAAAPSSGVGAKVKRPPTFDFMGVLTKGRSEDRRAAFEDARAKEYEYRFYRHGANLDTWLETISTFHSGAGVYTAGRPPPATQQELKRAAPSRTMSSHFRPAKNVTKEALGTLGEKSARKAKGFFSRGKSLLKS